MTQIHIKDFVIDLLWRAIGQIITGDTKDALETLKEVVEELQKTPKIFYTEGKN